MSTRVCLTFLTPFLIPPIGSGRKIPVVTIIEMTFKVVRVVRIPTPPTLSNSLHLLLRKASKKLVQKVNVLRLRVTVAATHDIINPRNLTFIIKGC